MLHRQNLVFVNLPGAKVSTAGSFTDSAYALAVSAPKIFAVPVAEMVGMCPGPPISEFRIDLNRAGDFAKLLNLMWYQ